MILLPNKSQGVIVLKMCALIAFMFTTVYPLSLTPVLKAGNSWEYYHYEYVNNMASRSYEFIGKAIITIDSILIRHDSTYLITKTFNNGTFIFEQDTIKDSSFWSLTIEYLCVSNRIFIKSGDMFFSSSEPIFLYGYNQDSIQYKIKYKNRTLNLNSYCSAYNSMFSDTIKYLDSIGLIFQASKTRTSHTYRDEILTLSKINGIDFDSTSIMILDSTNNNIFKPPKKNYSKVEGDVMYYLLNGRKLSNYKNSNPYRLNIHLKLVSDTYLHRLSK